MVEAGQGLLARRVCLLAALFASSLYAGAALTIPGAGAGFLILNNATVGQSYSSQLPVSGGTAPYHWSTSGAPAPGGLLFDSTGILSGVPNVPVPQTAYFQVQVTDSSPDPQSATALIGLKVNAAPLVVVTLSLPATIAGLPFSQTLQATGGVTPYTWSLSNPGCLAGTGLSLSAAGVLSGAALAPGTIDCAMGVTDQSGSSAFQRLPLLVKPQVSIATPATLPATTSGQPYGIVLLASGGTGGPYTWLIAPGSALPAGLALEGSGQLHGTPSVAGSFSFVVSASDGVSTAAQLAASLSIYAPLDITTATLPAAIQALPYSRTLAAAGGHGTYLWSAAAGLNGTGLALSSGGTLSGAPLAAGPIMFTARVMDDTGNQKDRVLSVSVNAALSIVSASSLPAAVSGQNYVFTFAAQGGGGGPYTWAVAPGSSLPPGLTLNSAGALQGPPSQPGNWTFTVTVGDGVSPSVQLAASLPIYAPVSLTSSQNPSLFGQNVTLTATLSPGAATGAVTFKDGATILGTGALSNGTATFTTSTLSVGAHSLTVGYAGDVNYPASSSAAVAQTVNPAPTTTALTSSLNPSAFGQNVTFTATISRPGATGTVTFTEGDTTLGTATLSGGTATFSTAGLTAGQHSLIAAYAGDSVNLASSSAALPQTVNKAISAVTLTSSANPSPVAQPLTLRAAVTPLSATGTVIFRDGSATLGTSTLSEGFATLSTSLAFGAHSLTAAYAGDQNHAAGVSSALSQTGSYPPLLITTSALPAGQAGQPYGPAGLNATGGSGLYSWSASGLPQGISLSSSGSLSGSAAAAFNGSVAVTVTDGISNTTATASYTLSITATPLLLTGPASLGSVVAGATVSGAFSATGGKPPYTWSVAGAPGLSIDAGGNVSGAAGTGVFSATVTATDSLNASVSRTAAFSGFGITSGGLPPASTTSDYGATISVAGGTAPYTFTASGLQAGITFAGGSFGGRPLNPGSASVAVQSRDSAGLTVSAAYTLTVTGPSALKIFSTALGDATVGQSYSDTLGASGGVAPYAWSQSGGLLPAGLSLSASGAVTGMPSVPGPYSLGVQVADAAGGRVVGTVTLNVKPAPLTITSGAAFPAGVVGSDYPAQILTASGGVPPYTFSVRGALPAGLSLSNGQLGGTPTAAADGGFTLAAADSSQPPLTGLLGARLSIRPLSPDLVVAAGSVAFELTAGTATAPSPASVGVSSSVIAQIIDFSTSASVPWLIVSPGSATPGVVSVGVNSAALALLPAGSPYSGVVTVNCASAICAGKSQTIAVALTVSAPPPQLSLGTTLLSFAALTSTPQSSTSSLTLINSGGGSLKINSVASDASWLTAGGFPATVMPGPGGVVNLTADPAGLAPGYYRATVSVASSGGNATAAVTLFISAAATMSLGPAGTQFSLPEGGALGNAAGSFSVSASSGATVVYTASALGGTPWLAVTDGSGTATSANSGTVGYTINPAAVAGLPAGAYYGTIRVSGAGVVNSPQDFQVVLSVTPATTPVLPDPQPAGLVFVSAGGAALASQTISVYASSRPALPFQASATVEAGQWISVSPTQGTASASSPGLVSVAANPAGLLPGVYRGTVSFAFGSAVRAVNVTLIVVTPQNAASAVPTLLSDARAKEFHPAAAGPVCANALLVPTQTGLVSNFSAPTSWPTQLAVKLFDTCGSVVSNGQMVATFTNGDPPLPLTSVNTGSGLYSGTWTPRKTSSAVTITATATVPGYPATSVKIAGQVSPNSAPVLAPNATGDVFHPQVGAGLGPGNIVQIYGSGLAAQRSAPTTLPLPTTMGGTSVIIGGIPAPLFYVSPDQINAQIPFELTAGNQYQVIVSANGALTTPQPIQLNGGAPSILGFSSGAVVAQHLDGTLILDSSPAVPGEFVIIYSSGLGATDIPVVSGSAAPADPPARVADPPVVALNGNPVTLLFAGLTPGFVGLYQLNFQIPAEIATGNYELVLTQSGALSNKTVLAIQSPAP